MAKTNSYDKSYRPKERFIVTAQAEEHKLLSDKDAMTRKDDVQKLLRAYPDLRKYEAVLLTKGIDSFKESFPSIYAICTKHRSYKRKDEEARLESEIERLEREIEIKRDRMKK